MSEVKFNVSISHESQLSQLKFCDLIVAMLNVDV